MGIYDDGLSCWERNKIGLAPENAGTNPEEVPEKVVVEKVAVETKVEPPKKTPKKTPEKKNLLGKFKGKK